MFKSWPSWVLNFFVAILSATILLSSTVVYKALQGVLDDPPNSLSAKAKTKWSQRKEQWTVVLILSSVSVSATVLFFFRIDKFVQGIPGDLPTDMGLLVSGAMFGSAVRSISWIRRNKLFALAFTILGALICSMLALSVVSRDVDITNKIKPCPTEDYQQESKCTYIDDLLHSTSDFYEIIVDQIDSSIKKPLKEDFELMLRKSTIQNVAPSTSGFSDVFTGLYSHLALLRKARVFHGYGTNNIKKKLDEGVEMQLYNALNMIEIDLKHAGMQFKHVAKVVAIVEHLEQSDTVMRIFKRFFSKSVEISIFTKELLPKQSLVEIVVITRNDVDFTELESKEQNGDLQKRINDLVSRKEHLLTSLQSIDTHLQELYREKEIDIYKQQRQKKEDERSGGEHTAVSTDEKDGSI